jgi:hypothetical protein
MAGVQCRHNGFSLTNFLFFILSSSRLERLGALTKLCWMLMLRDSKFQSNIRAGQKSLVQYNMKKIYTLAAVLLIFAVAPIKAQMKYGITGGLSHSSWKGDAVGNLNNLLDFADGMITTRARNGVFAGGFVEMPLGGGFSIQPGVYYSQKGYAMEGRVTADKLDFLGAGAKADLVSHYIDIPVVLKAEVAKGFQVYAGPQLSYLLKSNLKMDAGLLGISLFKRTMDVTENFNKADLGLTGGAAYTFENGFSVTASYDHGLSRLDKNSSFKSYNRGFKVGIGYTF